MKIKIFEHSGVKIKYDDDLPKAVKFFKDHNIDIEFFYPEKTNILLKDCPAKLYLPNDKGYDILMYIFDRSQRNNSYALNFSKTLQVIEISTSPDDDATDYTWKLICHEIMHTFFHRLNNVNIWLTDPMDSMLVNGVSVPYYKNEEPYAPDGNFATAFRTLNLVALKRKTDDGVQTLGNLLKWVTLERPWKNNVPNTSCVPKGIYRVHYSWSVKFLKYTYELLNIPNRSGIRIHSANFYSELLGCISLGTDYSDINHDTKLDILNSRISVSNFETLMGKKDFTILIE
jgi:hypothetical protein